MDMRRIIDLIETTSLGKLYHGTSIFNFIQIIIENAIRDDLGQDDFHAGVSLTSSFDVAANFAAQSEEYMEYSEQFPPKPNEACGGVVLEFDRDAIGKGCGLKAVQWDGVQIEREERTFGPIPNAKTMIRKFTVSDADLDWYEQLALEYDFSEEQVGVLHSLRASPHRIG